MMSREPVLEVDYVSAADLTGYDPKKWRDVLGVALFCADDAELPATVPVARIMARPLRGQPALCEVWRASGPFREGRSGRVHYRANEYFAFGCISLPESTTLREATEQAYADVFRCVATLNFPHVLRIWNYLPEINRSTDGLERYRQFNEARHRAFEAFHQEIRGNVPAACALGSMPGGALVIYFLASAQRGDAIENPRQTSAYDYPPIYGAYSPKFSRATLAQNATHPTLFISGTASIIGHHTMHAGDVLAQTRETVNNIRALVSEANRTADDELFAAEQLKYKVYLRNAGDLDCVARELDRTMPHASPIVYLQADVCRADLLIEIEAVGCTGRSRPH